MIYVHAGYAKCASTTIQAFLAANAGLLATHGLIFPDLETPLYPSAHHALPKELRSGPGPAWEKLHAIIGRRPPGANVILSSENLNGVRPEVLRAALGNEDVKIVFYIKDLAGLILSRYAHRTKTGTNTLDFDAFFDGNADHQSLDFPRHLAKWADAFGARNIGVRLLDKNVLVKGDVRFDILDAAGITEGQMNAVAFRMTRDHNASPGWKILEILRDLNSKRSPAPNGKETDRAADDETRYADEAPDVFWLAVRKVGPSGFTDRGNYLTEEQFAQCADRFNAYADALEKMGMETRLTRVSHQGFVARPFLPSIEHVPAADVAAYLSQLKPVLALARGMDDPKHGLFAEKSKRRQKSRRPRWLNRLLRRLHLSGRSK